MDKVIVHFTKKAENDKKLDAILAEMKNKFSNTFEASFLAYAGLLAESANNKDHSKVLAEAQKIIDIEVAAIKEGFSKIEQLITTYISDSEKELAEMRKLRCRQEQLLTQVEESIKKHYWG